jgi:tetratricopeptide (TPR) repeat protein
MGYINMKKIAFIIGLTVVLSSCGYLNSELHRKQTDALYRQGQGLYKSKKYDEAKKAFAALLEKDGGHYEGAFAFGAACYALGQYKEARNGFERAEAIDSTDEAKSWLIETHLKLGQKDLADKIAATLPAEKGKAFAEKIANAVPVLDASEQLDPKDEKILGEAFGLMKEGLYSDARKAVSKILKDKPNLLQANIVLFAIEAGSRDYTSSIETAKNMLAATGGEIYLDAFKTEDRKLIISMLENVESGKAPVEMNLLTGLILCQNIEEPALGVEYIQQALKNAKPEEFDATLLYRIGNALWRAQKVEQAVKIYELSLKKNAAQPELIVHLANIQRYRLGNPAKADELQKGSAPISLSSE